MTNKEVLELSEQLGIGARSHSSSIVDAQADRVRRKAEREGLVREAQPEAEDKPAKKSAGATVSSKKPPPKKKVAAAEAPDSGPEAPATEPAEKPVAAEAPASPETVTPPLVTPAAVEPGEPAAAEPTAAEPTASPDSPVTPEAPAAPETPDRPRRVVTSSGSAKPPKPAPAAEEEVPVEKPKPEKAAPSPHMDLGAPPERRAAAAPEKMPRSTSGKIIPPPPGPPRSDSGRPIPAPPGQGARRTPAPGGSGGPGTSAPRPGVRPSGGGGGRPGGMPRQSVPGAGGRGPGGGPRGGPRRPRRKGRRRRNRDELQPMDVPTYTPEDAAVPEGEIVIERMCTPLDLGPKLNRTAADVVRFLMQQGEMITATQSLSDDMIELFAAEISAEIKLVDPGEEQEVELQKVLEIPDDVDVDVESLPIRPPVVTVMGHVDHGKTKLLDRVRSADVAEGEAGGITQHIGAYQVTYDGKPLTFIDTPGHEAFTAMRARGADATDIVVLVVAADDGVMPQTVEALEHARAADVPIIVAINKIDRENADPNRVMTELAERELVPEAWGGDTVMVEISALAGTNIEELLESIQVVAELEDLRATEDGRATGLVLEAQLDIGRGPVATVLVQRGTLRVGDPMVAGPAWGRVRALVNDQGEQVKEAGPSTPVQVLGLSDVATAGDPFVVAPTEKVASKVADTREHRQRQLNLGRDAAAVAGGAKLEDIFEAIQAGQTATLNLVLKADVTGSLEALTESLKKLEREEVRLAFVLRGVGGITPNDIQLAAASSATLIGFNVRPDRKAREMAEAEGVEIRSYEIIYKVLEDIEAAMLGMLEPEYEEIVTGEAEVREIFGVPRIGKVAGCYITNGVITRGSKVRFLREGTIIWKGSISSLKRFKEDVREVQSGFECGIGLSDFQDLKAGDIIETFDEREIPREALHASTD